MKSEERQDVLGKAYVQTKVGISLVGFLLETKAHYTDIVSLLCRRLTEATQALPVQEQEALWLKPHGSPDS